MLSATLLAAGVSADWIRDRFAKLGDRLPYELFHRDPSYWFDISHPRHIDRPTFIFSGLFYALGKEARRFVDNHIHDALIRAAYQVVEGVPVLTLPLFKDPSLASNSLQSFLGCDRGEIFFHLLGPEHSPTECRDSLVAITEQSIKRLAENPNDLGSWARIFAIIGDMHPYKETIGSMATLLKQIDFTKLTNCQIAMFAATAWAVNIGDDELRKYLKQQLFKICELKGGARGGVDNGKPSELEKGALLLESALNLARAMYPRELLHSEFSDIVRGMVKAWPALVPVFRPVAQRLCDELPMSAARELYPLLLQLRAS